MFTKKSRYQNAVPFAPNGIGETPFQGVLPRKLEPATARLEHRVVKGDRLDDLARNYYNDPRLWWRIVDANPTFFFGHDLVRQAPEPRDAYDLPDLADMVGEIILIPAAKEV